jgi:Replication protein
VTASLDTLESTVESGQTHVLPQTRWGSAEFDDLPPASPAEQSFAHAGWSQERLWIFQSLTRTGSSQRLLAAFASCGGNLWLAMRGDEPVLLANACHSRHCRHCANRKREALVLAVAARLKEARDRCRFVTLTLRCQPVPLADQLDRLLESFRRLRQRQWWKARVTGGCMFVELKLGENSRQWHVHLHLLTEGKFLDQRELGEEWHKVTGDSFIVDVRAIAADDKIASYVAKYATKPLHSNVIQSPAHLDECIVAVRSRRLVNCFGCWKGLDADTPEPGDKPKSISRVDSIFANAAGGDADAIRWAEVLLRKWPTLTHHFTFACTLESPGP